MNAIDPQPTPDPARRTALGPRELTRSTPVQATLLILYCLPLGLLLIATCTSWGFTGQSSFLEMTLTVTTQYFDQLREAFATFVVPFVTAYAVAGSEPNDLRGLRPLALFFILVAMVSTAILLLGFLDSRQESFEHNLELSSRDARTEFIHAQSLLISYIKEVLTYISLILGISAIRGK